ncbi:MAG TPA: hypothetical protein PLQ41_00450 [bacterium]|nr:hypothetical protein [bacterium]HPP30185.1 hypothetical protein [bacterium]
MSVKYLIKRHLVWMIISYIVIGIAVYIFFLSPQKKIIQEQQKEKNEIEYAYMKITSSPSFLKSLNEAVVVATLKKNDFLWLDKDIDRGLALYNYLYSLSRKTKVDLLEIVSEEKTSTTAKKTEEEKLYYRWKVKLTGSFPDIVSFIDEIENSRKFLIVREIYISRGKGPYKGAIYEITFLGLKNNVSDNGENGKDK